MNGTLLFGVIGLILLAFLTVTGPSLAPYSADFSENFYYEETDQGRELIVSPAPPSDRHRFGSDPWGYDILSLMLHGIRFTVIATLGITLGRVMLALGFATGRFLISGAHDVKENGSDRSSGILGSLPAFVVLYFLLFGISINPVISPTGLAMIQGTCMVLIGVPSIQAVILGQIAEISREEYVTAARSSGASPMRILRRHILPQFLEDMVIIACHESIAVQTLIGQLGIFYVFLGGTRFTPSPPLYHSMTHEWAGLVGQYRNKLMGGHWWVAAAPLAGYLLVLIVLYALSRGAERSLGKRYRKSSHLN